MIRNRLKGVLAIFIILVIVGAGLYLIGHYHKLFGSEMICIGIAYFMYPYPRIGSSFQRAEYTVYVTTYKTKRVGVTEKAIVTNLSSPKLANFSVKYVNLTITIKVVNETGYTAIYESFEMRDSCDRLFEWYIPADTLKPCTDATITFMLQLYIEFQTFNSSWNMTRQRNMHITERAIFGGTRLCKFSLNINSTQNG